MCHVLRFSVASYLLSPGVQLFVSSSLFPGSKVSTDNHKDIASEFLLTYLCIMDPELMLKGHRSESNDVCLLLRYLRITHYLIIRPHSKYCPACVQALTSPQSSKSPP